MYDPYKALYIHIPFCKHRCWYCDFETSAVELDNPVVREYVDKLVLDIRHAGKEGKLSSLETVYLGGGTPSYIGQKYLAEILYTLGLSTYLTDEMEVSMEANPDSLTEPLVKDIWALGVNRLSIGVQSFDDAILKQLGRIHDGDKAREAIRIAKTRFENVSIDLICGVPGQTGDMFCNDLKEAIDLGVKHVSVYPLTIEPGTRLDHLVKSGQMPDVNEEDQAMMMAMAASILEPAGMPRYEVASYAYPGFECRHNIMYWTGKPYLGMGQSAVTMTQNSERRMRVQDGQVVDDLDRRQMEAEDMMLRMRMSRGASDEEVAQASLFLPQLLMTLQSLKDRNLLKHEGGRWMPTLGGWLYGNVVYGDILDLAP